jgi:EAL domain-containing protein (putative c-di-GMP-specific phosphodiesterase class I)
LLGLLLVTAAGALLPAYLAILSVGRDSVDRVTRTMAVESAQRFARIAVAPQVADGRLSPAGRDRLRRFLVTSPGLVGGRFRDRQGRLVAGARRPGALLGDDVLTVRVPVRARMGRGPLVGSLALHYDARHVRAQTTNGTRDLGIILLLVGIAVLAGLSPVLRTSARALARAHAERHPGLVRDLREAMRRRELALHYQPKLDLATGEVPSAEALLRWESPRRGTVPPGEFLPLVEETDVIDELTTYVAELAAAQLAAWRSAGIRLTLAINVSALTLRDPELPTRFGDILRRHGVEPETVILEVTETAVMERHEVGRHKLDRLSECGYAISIDDFGTGRSSLERLDRLPVDELKIDRAFIARMEETEDTRLVTAMIQLGHDLGMRVVAEGVESRNTVELLRVLGCDLVQGYAISRPVPDGQLRRWLAERRERTQRLARSVHPSRGKGPEGGRLEGE